MKRIDIDKNIKAKDIIKAAEKFAKVIGDNTYMCTGLGIIESVENGYYCESNATLHEIHQYGIPTSPQTSDWSYYWAIEHMDGNDWYAWYIER